MPTTQQLAITAEERFAIADTVARYCHAVDKHDKEEFVSVFAEDGYMGADMFGTYRGKDDTSTGLRACYDMLKSELFSDGGEQQHHVVNTILNRISADRISMWAEWMFLVMYNGVPRPAAFGEYQDVFVRVGDEWLIESRIVTCAQGRGPQPLRPDSPAQVASGG